MRQEYRKKHPSHDAGYLLFAILALGQCREGDSFFKDAYLPNLNPPFRVIAETKGGTNPYFITGAGGVLQAVMMGFGGLDITDNGIVQEKTGVLPTHWKTLTLKGIGTKGKTYLRKR